ncbi:hypothetical protein [Streptomyces sp. NBC_00454]|uniref:hypothetical protein n=1 Tax=Streptomyces sp. NBC_00454 TaxID=2975747 RepID=UPI0030DEDBB7
MISCNGWVFFIVVIIMVIVWVVLSAGPSPTLGIRARQRGSRLRSPRSATEDAA